MATSVEGGKWYKCESQFSTMIVCGECAQQAIRDTQKGIYTGDEAVNASMYTELTDADTEPYQCDDCLTQNEAYDEVGEDE